MAAVSQDQDFHLALYAAAQQALRNVVGTHVLAHIAGQRAVIATAMQAAMSASVAELGITIHAALVKDVMPNAETRKAMAAVAFAKQEALAALEKARGEQAALRALANAARMIREQPELAHIRSLQALADGLRAGAHVVVSAQTSGLVPVIR